jgi:hypothetical protein
MLYRDARPALGRALGGNQLGALSDPARYLLGLEASEEVDSKDPLRRIHRERRLVPVSGRILEEQSIATPRLQGHFYRSSADARGFHKGRAVELAQRLEGIDFGQQ